MGILVFLHVQVDKLAALAAILIHIRIIDGCLVELRHAAYQLGETLFIVERMCLGIDTRDFYGYIVDVWIFQCFQIAVIAFVGFSIAQYHLAQKVHVLPDFLLKACGQMLGQMGPGSIDDNLRGVHSQTFLDDGDGNEVEVIAKRLVHFEEEPVACVQELGYTILVDEHLNALGQLATVTNL